MYKELVFACLAIVLILVSTTEARGGRGGGGRGGGRSGGRSYGGRRGSTSSISSSSSSSFGGRGGGMHTSGSGGWFHGFFHSTPYRYTYRPIYVSRGHPSTGSYQERKEQEDIEKETNSHALGYAISRALNSDFFSIFNVAHDISKYPEKIRNKEFLPSTTTEGPVSTYHINEIINPTYSTPMTTIDPKSFFLDDNTLFDLINTKKSEEFDKEIEQRINNFLQISRNFDNDNEKENEEVTTMKIDFLENILL